MKSFFLSVAILAIVFVGCKKETAEINNDYQPINLSLKGEMVVESSNKFGLDAFKRVVADGGEDKNVMISPLSITQALSMAWNGAKGDTKTEISSVLNIDPDLVSNYNEEQKTLSHALITSDKLVNVDIANSIWYRRGDVVLDQFVKTNQNYYGAEVSDLDFTKSAESVEIINDWVSDKTNDKITEIVKDISSDTYMFIINAVYFLGDWMYRFDANETRKETFTAEDGSFVQTDMMRTEETFNALLNDKVIMVELPYGNGHFSMLLMLPTTDNISGFVGNLTEAELNSWIDAMNPAKIQVVLPKFKFAAEYDLNKTLAEMGMPTAFSDMADFSDINGIGGIYISKVKHKTFIDVNEKGTEAAAVTSIGFTYTSVGPDQPLVIRFDRPFVYAIREKDTGAILFIGKMANPVLN